MAPDDSEILCEGWQWDSALRELRKYQRKGKGWEDEPEAIERLKPVSSVIWHRWSQAPMQTPTGQMMPASLSRIVAVFEGGGNLTLNEFDRACADKLAQTIANAYGHEVIEAGAPGGRRGGNLPARDEMGRLVTRQGKVEVILDEVGGEITLAKRRFPFGKSKRVLRTNEVRWIELAYEVKGPAETFTVVGIVGAEEEKIPFASFSGYEGWADHEEWHSFARELGRSLGVEVRP